MIVNKAFAQEYFPNVNALGQHFQWDDSQRAIVGVVSDAKYRDLRSTLGPTMYVPSSGGGARFELRTRTDPLAIVSAVRAVVNELCANPPIFDLRTQTQMIDQLLSQERMIAELSVFFGILALVLACIGLYGLLSYEVVRRTREIGIRIALGAERGAVLSLVIGQGVALVLMGTAIGIAGALGVTRFISAMLYGIHADDPLTFIAVAFLLTLVALAACYIPARRATRVDPLIALRHQ